MSRCDLFLENYQDHYSNGDTIVGHVQCAFTSDKEIHGIIVTIRGEAEVKWTESESHYNSTTKRNESRTVYYRGSHQLMHKEIDLLQNGGGEVTIPKGAYSYSFTYILPNNLPSTFKGHLGKIEYKIKAVVKRPMLKFNYEAESPFVIVTPVNLNYFPELQNSVTRNKTKTTYFCCWSKGDIKVQASIPRGGIAIGEALSLNISVENLSQTNIESIKCKVQKNIEFTVTSPHRKHRHDKDTIYTDTYSGIGAHGENTYNKTILINNASVVSNYLDCNVINVTYELVLCLELSGWHTNIELEFPIKIGHIPFGASNPQQTPPPAYSGYLPATSHSAPIAPSAPGTLPYGFVAPGGLGSSVSIRPPINQPAYNPSVMPSAQPDFGLMPIPPMYGQMNASAPPIELAKASTGKKKDDWDMLDDSPNYSRNQALPSYDEAVKYPTKS